MNKAEKSNPELAEAVKSALPSIDQLLDAEDRELSLRPMAATDLFIDYFILEIRNVPEGKRYLQEWYALIFAIVAAWYKRKYGQALHAKRGLIGVIEIHGMPFRVKVPETYADPHPEESTSDLCFGPSPGAVERPRSWIDTPPALDALTSRQSVRLDRDLAAITRVLRTINLKFMMADPAPNLFKQHRAVALGSIRKAAEDLVNRGPGDIGAAVWEAHFALESAIKAAIAQTGTVPPIEHGLTALLRAATSAGVSIRLSKSLGFLPGAKGAIALRHGTPLKGGYRAAYRIYQRTLPLLEEIATQLQYSFGLEEGARITLKKPPWFQFMDDAPA